MASYYDDNFGFYDIDGEDDIEAYFRIQEQSVWKRCSICDKKVKLLPHYDKCNACTERIERGLEG